jgi:hypothetical protein
MIEEARSTMTTTRTLTIMLVNADASTERSFAICSMRLRCSGDMRIVIRPSRPVACFAGAAVRGRAMQPAA